MRDLYGSDERNLLVIQFSGCEIKTRHLFHVYVQTQEKFSSIYEQYFQTDTRA